MRIKDIFYFLQGYARYGLVVCFDFGILREHVRDQIVARVLSAKRECKDEGRCVMCGCHTPALFYADKACDGDCYPKMMGRERWEAFVKAGGDADWNYIGGRFYKVKEVIDERIF